MSEQAFPNEGHPITRTLVTTLLELVHALCEAGATDIEVVTTLRELMNSGRVKFIGEFRASHIQQCLPST